MYDQLLSSFDIKLHLHVYIQGELRVMDAEYTGLLESMQEAQAQGAAGSRRGGGGGGGGAGGEEDGMVVTADGSTAGAYTRPLFGST